MPKFILPMFLLICVATSLRGSAPLSPVDAFVVSHGYGGAQFVRAENTYRLPINVNGKVGDLTIDTGASTSVVFTPSAKKFGLQATLTSERVHGAFGKGKEKVGIASIQRLTMGNLTLMNVKVAVLSDWFSGGLYRPYGASDGLFGLREMLRYGAVLDLPSHLILVHPGGPMKNISDDIRSILTKEGYTPVPLKVVDGHLQVSAVLNGTACKLVVDTGAYFTAIHRPFARRAKIGGYDVGLNAQGLGTGGRGVGYSHFPELKLGNFAIHNVSVTVSDLDPAIAGDIPDFAGLLGADYLGLCGAVFDFNNPTVYLRPKKG
jgi:predicted aspartyl protease